jgi:hypothetical protein
MFVHALPHNGNNELSVMLVRSATETSNANSDLVRQSVRTRQHLCCQPRSGHLEEAGCHGPWQPSALLIA